MSPSVSLFGKRVLADVIKMRSYWNRVDLGFSKTGNLVKRGKCGHRHTHTHTHTHTQAGLNPSFAGLGQFSEFS